MIGLDAALAEAKGKRVLDLGAAEGLIGRAFAEAGAAEVVGIEGNPTAAKEARRQTEGKCRILLGMLGTDPLPPGKWDIVLALAILHKLQSPEMVIGEIAVVQPELVVVRLPAGSTGYVVTKRHGIACDIPAVFRQHGFRLDQDLAGPFDERVHYWRRVAK